MRMYDDPMQSEIDVFNAVYQLRKERRYLVQTLSQYTYLYKCLYEHAQKKNPSWNLLYSKLNKWKTRRGFFYHMKNCNSKFFLISNIAIKI